MNEKQSNTCLCSGGRQHLATHISLVLFFIPKVLIQSPAQANNFKFPAMASPRRVIFLILVRICLPAHERASGWPQSGGSHNSDAEICRSGPCCMYPSGKHLPTGCRSETDISLTRTVSAVRVSDSAAGSGPVGLNLWASRGLARAVPGDPQCLPACSPISLYRIRC